MDDQELSQEYQGRGVHLYYHRCIKDIEIITNAVVEPFKTTLLDDTFFPQADPFAYTQTMHRINNNDDFLRKVKATIEEATKLIDHKEKIPELPEKLGRHL